MTAIAEGPKRKIAGIVKIMPAASDSPAEPIVCTMLFSSSASLRKTKRNTPIEITAAGIDAEIVSPTRSPKYAFAAPNTIARITPSVIDVTVSSRARPFVFSSFIGYERTKEKVKGEGEENMLKFK